MNLCGCHPFFCTGGARGGSRRASGRGSGFDAAAAEELFEGGVDVLLVVDADADEALLLAEAVVEDGEQRAGRAPVAPAALLADLAVAEEVAGLDELVGEADGLLVVRVVV